MECAGGKCKLNFSEATENISSTKTDPNKDENIELTNRKNIINQPIDTNLD